VAAFHVNADIADAVARYVRATGDAEFDHDVAVELLVETARLWRSLGHHDVTGAFRIDGVTGPDEYSAVADNNVYTNLMARRNLMAAAEACARHQDKAHELGVTPGEMASWRAAAEHMFIPYDARLGVHSQAEDFTTHEVWDFAATKPDQYPLMLNFPYFDLYRKQVVKQADLVLAMHLCSDQFTADQKARNFAYYERITVRDSSLSACTQAVLAAEVGHARLALDYVAEAALIDLQDFEHNTRDGLHIAALAGTWIGLVAGFGGARAYGDTLSFAPRLPEGLTGLSFTMVRRGIRLQVSIDARTARYRLLDDGTLEIQHHGQPLKLQGTTPVEKPIPPATEREPPEQPAGREPWRRSPQARETGEWRNEKQER
jgi:alpha,alpha-trehalose phosphorylase